MKENNEEKTKTICCMPINRLSDFKGFWSQDVKLLAK